MVIAHLKAGDILFLLSTSGTSENILKAIDTASKLKIQTYLWTGLTCPLEDDSLLRIMKASTTQTPRVQEIHLIWGHLLAELVEELNA
jgi:D-sedoheptulose 7-phosphate isomerase